METIIKSCIVTLINQDWRFDELEAFLKIQIPIKLPILSISSTETNYSDPNIIRANRSDKFMSVEVYYDYTNYNVNYDDQFWIRVNDKEKLPISITPYIKKNKKELYWIILPNNEIRESIYEYARSKRENLGYKYITNKF
jgi:hypothetical protein